MANKKSTKFTIKGFFHKSFIPNKKNSFRPHAFRHFMLSVYSLALIVSQLSFGAVQYTQLTANPQELKGQVFAKINSERIKNSRSVFTENPLLSEAAAKKLSDMFQNNYWDHTSPSGEKAWVFIDETGYSYTLAGENLAKGFVTADGMVSAWMESPTHKKNILDNNFVETGIAVGNGVIDGKQVTVAVQLFGKPSAVFAQGQSLVAGERSVTPQFSLENPVNGDKLPYFIIYLAIFALVILDGAMIRAGKKHKNKKHMLSFRTSLAINAIVLLVLCLNLAYVL